MNSINVYISKFAKIILSLDMYYDVESFGLKIEIFFIWWLFFNGDWELYQIEIAVEY